MRDKKVNQNMSPTCWPKPVQGQKSCPHVGRKTVAIFWVPKACHPDPTLDQHQTSLPESDPRLAECVLHTHTGPAAYSAKQATLRIMCFAHMSTEQKGKHVLVEF